MVGGTREVLTASPKRLLGPRDVTVPMRLTLPLVVMLALFPLAAAQSSLILGTEEEPELPGIAGDVVRQAFYTGPTDFVDFTAGWWDHDNQSDVITANIRVAGAESLASAPPGYNVGCI